MKNIIIIICISVCFAYNVGDLITNNHLNQEFELCYPGTLDNTMSLGDYNGNTNGGDYHILLIDMSATWCGPCQSLIPLFDQLHENYSNNDYVEILVALSDLNQPYSCTQWGNMGTSGLPSIIDDVGYTIFNMFGSGAWPSLVFIDHEMRVHYKEAGYYTTFVEDASEIIDEMLVNMENSLILYSEIFFTLDQSGEDGDGILNPDEEFTLDFIISNNSFYLDGINISGIVQSVDDITQNYSDITFTSDEVNFGDIDVGSSSVSTVSGSTGTDVFLGTHDFELIVTAGYIDLDGNYNETTNSYPFSIDVSLNQLGFPFDTNSKVESSPAIVDLDGDGNSEIIFGDNAGLIHVLDAYGTPVLDNIFPYDTGNQIWGSPAVGDIDNDGILDLVFTSKSKHLYVLDRNGLKLDYYANQYLMGTPALGNLDDDADLEIVFGGFSSGAKLFAVNIDGSDVSGFPLLLDEKMQKGVALADFDDNGRDDIVVGTDDDNIHLIYDNGTIGFSFLTGDKVRSAPIIIDIDGEKIIVVGSKDGKLYALNSNGELHFDAFDSGSAIYTSPTVLDTPSGMMIFFGNNEGELFALDVHGNLKDGFPISFVEQDILLPFSSIVGSVVFEDLDSDGLAEIIFGDEGGELHILKASDTSYSNFDYYNSMPFSNTFSYSSSLNIQDIDNDGDLEVFGGTTGDVIVLDIKEESVGGDYWNTYRGNYLRNGLFITSSLCTAGDINNDGILNILDIVSMLNIIIDSVDLTELEECAADMNGDTIIDILDIVTLVNLIMG